MGWKEDYQRKLTTAEEAVKHIKSGDRLSIGHAVGEPTHLVEAMVRNKDQYENVEIIHMVAMGNAAYCNPEMEGHFRHNAIFIGASTRKPCAEGRVDVTPVYFSETNRMIRERLIPDVTMLTVSPPDEHGYCSCGVSVDYTRTSALIAKTTIAQINKYMPRTLGDSFIHVDDMDVIVEHDAPLIELRPAVLSEVELAIGRHCALLVHDGDTLQLGIGAIPDAVLASLTDKNDLGIHTEMFSDGVVDLVMSGNINNSKKTLHRGKSIATFLMGTQKLYDYVHNNPAVEMYMSDYTNNPYVAAQNDNLVSINSCVQVDLVGQVVSSTAGFRQISAVGGQVDFVRGARMSKGGRSIIAMPSTAAKGSVSKIVGVIDEGSAITTNMHDVEHVCTEFGMVNLYGLTLRERARALIGIAHPSFQDSLIGEYERRFNSKF